MATEVAKLRQQTGRGQHDGRQSERGVRVTSRGRKEQAGRSGRQGRREAKEWADEREEEEDNKEEEEEEGGEK